MKDFTATPNWDEFPSPVDDGATAHLRGMRIAPLVLAASDGTSVDLSAGTGRVVVYVYPRTGLPGVENPTGWDGIPGARGCTPQSCSFRDHFAELKSLEITDLFGLSTQDTIYQREAAERLHLPFRLLSDQNLAFAEALRLPTFTVDGMTLLRRMTLILKDGKIEHVMYPVFPPDRNAGAVIAWLREQIA